MIEELLALQHVIRRSTCQKATMQMHSRGIVVAGTVCVVVTAANVVVTTVCVVVGRRVSQYNPVYSGRHSHDGAFSMQCTMNVPCGEHTPEHAAKKFKK